MLNELALYSGFFMIFSLLTSIILFTWYLIFDKLRETILSIKIIYYSLFKTKKFISSVEITHQNKIYIWKCIDVKNAREE